MIYEAGLLIFLAVYAWIDAKRKHVPTAGLLAAMAVVSAMTVLGARGVLSAALFLPEGSVREMVFGTCPGWMILAAALGSRGRIGVGDGLVYMLCGMVIGFWDCLMLMVFSLFLGSLAAGGIKWAKHLEGSAQIALVPFILSADALRVIGNLVVG